MDRKRVERDPKQCSKCGQAHAGCAGHRRDGAPCGNHPMTDQRTCRMHGGSSPVARRAAARRGAARAAESEYRRLGMPLEVDHSVAIMQELHRTAGAVEWYGGQVAALRASEIGWGMTREKEGGDDRGTTYEAAVNVYVVQWEKERDRLVRVAKTCHDMGIDERRVALAESQGQALAQVVRAVLARLNLTREQQELVSVVVPSEFRALAARQGQVSAGTGFEEEA